jgi:hypothetical protein
MMTEHKHWVLIKIVYYFERNKNNQDKDFGDFVAVKSVKIA